MSRIFIDSKNRLVFYGNLAGYVDENKAVADPQFQTAELERWLDKNHLKTEWQSGVFDKLTSGWDFSGEAEQFRNVRIWQLKPETDVYMKFISFDERLERFGDPDPADYSLVYDGNLGTENLDRIYEICNLQHPHGYHGHSLSMSDVVELYDENGSQCHYVDRFGFKEIDFAEQDMGMEMK